MSKRYIINGKYYTPTEADILCRDGSKLFDETITTLYYSPNGTFFTVTENSWIDGNETVKTIDREAAIAFMNAHSAGIVLDNYTRIFGGPTQG